MALRQIQESDLLPPRSICGQVRYFVYEHGEIRIILRCGTWGCPECGEYKIKVVTDKYKYAFEQIDPRGTQVWVTFIPGTKDYTDHFIKENLGKKKIPWSRISSECDGRQGVWVIAQKSFPEAARKNREAFFGKEFPGILRQPWERKGNEHRISHSKEIRIFFRNKKVPNQDLVVHLPDELKKKWDLLKNDHEKIEFMLNIPSLFIGPAGVRMIKERSGPRLV